MESAAGFSSVKMLDEVVSIVSLALSPVLTRLQSVSILKKVRNKKHRCLTPGV